MTQPVPPEPTITALPDTPDDKVGGRVPTNELALADRAQLEPMETPEAAAARTGHFLGCTCDQCPTNLPLGTDPGDN